MAIEIKRWDNGAVIYTSNCDTLREAVVEALKKKVNLSYSDLSGSNLSGSNLRGSNLSYSDLSYSNLSYSNLSDSDLSYSDLSGSNLSDSNLSYSNLSGSNLSGSNLRGSNLSDSDLSYSDLSGSNLSGSNLRGSNLSDSKDGSVCRMDFGGWSICIRSKKTSIGCQTQDNAKWLKWTPKSKEICDMHEEASAWWTLHGPAVKAAIKVVTQKARMEGKK